MTCKAYKNMFEKYMEGVLQQAELEQLQEHVKTCGVCEAAYQDFSHMQAIVQDSLNPTREGKDKISKAIADIEIQPHAQCSLTVPFSPFLRYGAAAAVFLVIGLWIGSRPAPLSTAPSKPLAISISQLEGDILVKHAWEDGWKKLTAEGSIYKGDSFLSRHQANLVLLLDENNTVALNENSELNILDYNGQMEFGIPYGTVKATLEGPHEPFFVSTPQGRFEALGTEFIVRVR